MHDQEKTSLEQEAKAGLLAGSLTCLGLVAHLLHVVVVMMVMVMVVVAMMVTIMMVVTMVMMLCHWGRVRARRADHWHHESDCSCKPEGRKEGLLHWIVSFFRWQVSIGPISRPPRMELRS
ncbi:hypothetical protein [Mesorhizobium sp. SARCC-RB16n]|uniref:hypothetical protein n=1 Tax=Mesorhizobium sp. SARCC-RB16n TaxID=2116687 RepID=UPI00166C936C|nr:hypothetical protein [Mesorhizobium sp. SARCC-RB16n]